MRQWWISAVLLLSLWAQGALASTVLVVGDSISAAFGLNTSQGWVQLLQERLDEQGFKLQVVNASISGDTSSGGLARLPQLLQVQQPSIVIIELGGNDGLRGQSLAQLQQNLAAMIEHSQKSGAKVMLLGMLLPPNYGPRYTQGFAQIYPDLAAAYNTELVPFFLEGLPGVEGMLQSDGIHPTAQAQPVLLENMWPNLQRLLCAELQDC